MPVTEQFTLPGSNTFLVAGAPKVTSSERTPWRGAERCEGGLRGYGSRSTCNRRVVERVGGPSDVWLVPAADDELNAYVYTYSTVGGGGYMRRWRVVCLQRNGCIYIYGRNNGEVEGGARRVEPVPIQVRVIQYT